MSLLQNSQTNWKYLLIIAVLALVIVGICWWQKNNIEKIFFGQPEITEPRTCKDFCGDGTCQEIVCMAIGCPCAETEESCPQDCAGIDISSWQTYRNEEYGFELKYPRDIYFKEFAVRGPIIAMGIKENDYSLLAAYIDDSTGFGKYCDNQKNFNIDDSPAQKCYFEQCADFCQEDEQYYNAYSIEILHNKLRYNLVCSDLSHESLCNQILSTFKFIEGANKTECIDEGDVLCDVTGCGDCCSGLVSRYVTHPMKNKFNEVICVENMTMAVCVKCGNGFCGEAEDWCICPEDCVKPSPDNLELQPY